MSTIAVPNRTVWTTTAAVEESPTWNLWTLSDPVWVGLSSRLLNSSQSVLSPTEGRGKEGETGGGGGEKKTASLGCEWWVAAMGDILPSLFLSLLWRPNAFTPPSGYPNHPHFPWYFSPTCFISLKSFFFHFFLSLRLLFFHTPSSSHSFLSAVTPPPFFLSSLAPLMLLSPRPI